MKPASISAKSIIAFIVLLLLSSAFFFSAIAKFISIEPFEWTFMDMGLPNQASFFLARFFIGFEFVLAILLLAHSYLKKITLPLTNIFLLSMTVYLIILWISKGNDVDCGCFGDALPMSPSVSILKNLVMMIVTYWLQRNYPPLSYRFQLPIALVLTLASFIIPFIFVPYTQKPEPINLDALYADAAYKPMAELRKGKHLIAFMSLGCPHCRSAANIFKEMYAEDSTLPIMMILNGSLEDTADFFNETKSNKVPHFVFNNNDAFIKMAGKYVPQIYWVNNGIKERKITYIQLNTALLKNWKN